MGKKSRKSKVGGNGQNPKKKKQSSSTTSPATNKSKKETPPPSGKTTTEKPEIVATASVEASASEVEVSMDKIQDAPKPMNKQSKQKDTVTAAGEEKQAQKKSKKKGKSAKDKEDLLTKQQTRGPIKSVMNSISSIGSSMLSPKSRPLPPALESSLHVLSPPQQKLAKKLCWLPGSTNQSHLFENWSNDPQFDTKKKDMMAKLESVDESYPDGGLIGYLQNAVRLLENSFLGKSHLDGWTPSVPKGMAFEIGSDDYLSTERLGLEEVGRCGFVLVAGG